MKALRISARVIDLTPLYSSRRMTGFSLRTNSTIFPFRRSGVSQFNQLLSRNGEPVFYAFDLLWLDGRDLRQTPLVERKKRLARLVRAAECSHLLYAQHIEQHGKGFFAEICATLRGLSPSASPECIVRIARTGSRSRTRPIAKPKVGTIFSGGSRRLEV